MLKIDSVYDNPNLCDRYTVIFNSGEALALSPQPQLEQGFARWILVDDYDENQLGEQIEFASLPGNVQEYARQQEIT